MKHYTEDENLKHCYKIVTIGDIRERMTVKDYSDYYFTLEKMCDDSRFLFELVKRSKEVDGYNFMLLPYSDKINCRGLVTSVIGSYARYNGYKYDMIDLIDDYHLDEAIMIEYFINNVIDLEDNFFFDAIKEYVEKRFKNIEFEIITESHGTHFARCFVK